MVSNRCVVQGFSNTSDIKAGVSLHKSPIDRSLSLKWKAFVSTYRAQFNPDGRFVVCSDQLLQDCFERSFYLQGFRSLKQGSIPAIWQRSEKTMAVRPGIEPETSLTTDWRLTNWANQAAVKLNQSLNNWALISKRRLV